MPYNNTPIAPPKEYTGTVSLPLARVKKIIAADDDVTTCSNNAAFVIAVATEMFVQYFAERCYDVVKAERKPRRNIQYKDVASAVARIDNLEFLSDVAPRTQTYKAVKEQQAKKAAAQTQAEADVSMADAAAPMPPPQQRQLSFGPQVNTPVVNAVPVSPASTNGHRPLTHGHSRSHSLEQQNILHPSPQSIHEPMQVDGPQISPYAMAHPQYPAAIAVPPPNFQQGQTLQQIPHQGPARPVDDTAVNGLGLGFAQAQGPPIGHFYPPPGSGRP